MLPLNGTVPVMMQPVATEVEAAGIAGQGQGLSWELGLCLWLRQNYFRLDSC